MSLTVVTPGTPPPITTRNADGWTRNKNTKENSNLKDIQEHQEVHTQEAHRTANPSSARAESQNPRLY